MNAMTFGDAITYVAERQSGPPSVRAAKAYQLVAWLRQMAHDDLPSCSTLNGGELLSARLGPEHAVVFTVSP
jgi:hypothetical protein